MKAQIIHVDHHGVHYDCLQFVCPGCQEMLGPDGGLHMLPVTDTQGKSPKWDWDGNIDSPTLSPSILTHLSGDRQCHSYIRNGVIEFLDDCSHSLAGQHVPLPDLYGWARRD